ncbi:MAG: hypothetical protein R3B36_33170 [Polyangiaceae bacterium]
MPVGATPASNGDPNDKSELVGLASVLVSSVIVGKATAPKATGFSRALTAADLGVNESTVVQGAVLGACRKGDRYIRYLGGGLGRELLELRNGLAKTARAHGAQTLRIETSRIIEETGRLQPILERAGFELRSNGTMWWERAL